eukprot:613358_1
MCIVLVLCLLDVMHSKLPNGLSKCHPSDQMHYFQIFLFGLAVCNELSDIYITHQIVIYVLDTDGAFRISIHSVIALSAICFIIIPYVVTIISTVRIYKMECTNRGPGYWFEKHMVLFIVLELLSCDPYVTVSLIKSHVFGMNVFNSGHTTIELNKIRSIKLQTICTQNIPQIAIQFIFIRMIDHVRSILVVSMILSFVLSIPFLCIWLFGGSVVSEWKTYYIVVALLPPRKMLRNTNGQNQMLISTDLGHEICEYVFQLFNQVFQEFKKDYPLHYHCTTAISVDQIQRIFHDITADVIKATIARTRLL